MIARIIAAASVSLPCGLQARYVLHLLLSFHRGNAERNSICNSVSFSLFIKSRAYIYIYGRKLYFNLLPGILSKLYARELRYIIIEKERDYFNEL